ncbi:MAG: glucokinase [Thermodesulfobacteriota bacterium]
MIATPVILAADIGGTSGRFALFGSGPGLALEKQAVIPTAGHASFEELVRDALDALGPARIESAVLAVAGPVQGGRFCSPPNIGYDFDLDALPPGLVPAGAVLVNDFTAQAHGCRLFGEARSLPVLPGVMDESLTQAVVGAGTGLGKAALVPDGRGGFAVCGSEGGHAAFPFNGAGEADFQRFALDALREPYVRWESVVSGSGLALTHRYLTGEDLDPAGAAARLTPDAATTRWFARFLGRALRDYVLEVLARGGLYISGGVAAKNPQLVEHPAFREEFLSSATHPELLAAVPARLVTDQSVGLWGAAAYAAGMLARRG